MGAVRQSDPNPRRWRRRRMCTLVAGRVAPAALRQVNASGAYVETPLRPALGSAVELRHPEAGAIRGTVKAQASDGLWLAFAADEHSVAFALVALAADLKV